jgi:hypothetical protein
MGDNDATTPQLTCLRDASHDGLHDNIRGDHEPETTNMPKTTYPYLVVDDAQDANHYFISWQFEDDIGGTVGDVVYSEIDLKNCSNDDRDAIVASIAAGKTEGVVVVPGIGYGWRTEKLVIRALGEIKAAIKSARSSKPWPEWAIKARGAGWKPPKGWEP